TPWHPVPDGAPTDAVVVATTGDLRTCADQIEIRDGLAEPPAYRLRAGDGLEGALGGNAFFAPNGGTLVPISRTAQLVELPSEPGARLGARGSVVYDHPTGGYDLTVGTERRNGWTRLPALVGRPTPAAASSA
ncbi:MAG: hypothetical protein L0I24_14775, partial [Pseudonocardia sp.]|nr:hypothetical protein [Pseudonocardia sp.]